MGSVCVAGTRIFLSYMKTLNRNAKPLVFKGEGDDELEIRYTNRGEPYREGVEVEWRLSDWRNSVSVFLEVEEMCRLRDKLNEMLPLRE